MSEDAERIVGLYRRHADARDVARRRRHDGPPTEAGWLNDKRRSSISVPWRTCGWTPWQAVAATWRQLVSRSLTRLASVFIVKGLVRTCMPGSRSLWLSTALSA